MVDNKQIQPSKDHCGEQCALPQELPLDPAVERIRKKFMRFMIISISITLIMTLAVLFLVFYKTLATRSTPKHPPQFSSHNRNPEVAYHTLSLPKGTQILSQSLSEHNIVLKVLMPDDHIKFMVYNYHTGTLIAVLSVETTRSNIIPQPR
ncbi:hypothetical protein AT246_07515 [Bartonella henselae]|uniref:Hypothetical membrane protein n=1 Tax=Bartonella henselae TaxID=38323 RepID=X5M5Y1_BARHN|nr:hypothetical protein [Bartonella henselae]MDM9996885.1 hypothetical protein [Bartonella henselae]OLL50525.1 hypothetical protein AT247_05885 [Bartonella henselae]OLL51412.1 hypothetical protein AT241_00050 [Bartonella henselae]OLL52459.1 hypothetical protein AT243_04615 [Bartonella henselae]OLL53541.1 hypothetical protein AT240_02660 [Bartonella henselae]